LEKLNLIKQNGIEIDLIRDYELHFATRKAKIIMQTCAHVSGAAYFYDPKRFSEETLNLKKKVNNSNNSNNLKSYHLKIISIL